MIFSVFQTNLVFGYSVSTLLWYRCYYPHRSRDALSPVCGIFFSCACKTIESILRLTHLFVKDIFYPPNPIFLHSLRFLAIFYWAFLPCFTITKLICVRLNRTNFIWQFWASKLDYGCHLSKWDIIARPICEAEKTITKNLINLSSFPFNPI